MLPIYSGAVKLMTVCFVITVMFAILIKLFKATTRTHKHARKHVCKWTGVFACVNTLWACACVTLLTKCLWMIVNDNNDPDNVIRCVLCDLTPLNPFSAKDELTRFEP